MGGVDLGFAGGVISRGPPPSLSGTNAARRSAPSPLPVIDGDRLWMYPAVAAAEIIPMRRPGGEEGGGGRTAEEEKCWAGVELGSAFGPRECLDARRQ